MINIKTRLDIVLPYIKGKEVLDLGCINHNLDLFNLDACLHAQMKKHCKYLMGVDILKEEVKKLNALGYNIVCQDVEKLKINKKFDVVIAGELIEHLSNPGMLLESARKHLKNNGILILTTPNPYALDRSLLSLVKSFHPVNPEHTVYFTKETMKELLRRYGFRIKKVMYFNENMEFGYSNKPVIARIVYFIKNIRERFRETIIFICEKN